MSKERYLNTKFWDDNYIINLDPVEKLLFIYFLTNPLTNIIGIYEISIRRIAFDTGIDQDMVLKILERFERDNRIKYSQGYIVIKNFTKHQKNNPKINQGIAALIKEISKELIDWVAIDYDRLSKPLNYINTNTNTNLNTNTKRKYIYSPAINEIITYLNKKAGKDYKLNSKKTRLLIKTRLKEGFTVDNFKLVIDKKTKGWKGQINKDGISMESYLRPETLFGTKFESYLNEPDETNQEWRKYAK